MKTNTKFNQTLALIASLSVAHTASAQIKGPSTASTPYLLPTLPGFNTTSIITVDNTGATADDIAPKVGGGTYGLVGLPDGLGAFDNGDGTFTLLVNHEAGNGSGVTRDHGAIGSFVSKWVINKNTLAVVSGEDLMKSVYRWNSTTQSSNTTTTTTAFNRFCSADLPAPSAFYNSNSGLGSQERIFMHGEEGSSTGWLQGTVVTGTDAGKSYTLGKFNLSTNGSGLTAVGAWENALASPFVQDKTIVIGTNDGGTGIMSNSLSVYVGTKLSSGTEVEKAGLCNGTLKQVVVAGNAQEIANNTTRVTNITSGTRFSLSLTASTTFSRPEDGAWDPKNPNYFYFVTTDRFDQVSNGLGAQIGRTRLWRLVFDDISNPDLGGSIDILLDGNTVGGSMINMFDNMSINESNGHILLQEDVGGQAHNGKIWDFDPATGVLKIVVKHDPARFGDRVGGVTTAATSPFSNDEEASGIIDITAIMKGSALYKGNPREAWYFTADQAHYGTGITTAQVEGGQLLALHEIAPMNNVAVTRSGVVRDRSSGKFLQTVTIKNNNPSPLVGPFHLVLDSLSPSATLANASGVTTVYGPMNNSYITVPGSSLAPGATASIILQFNNPTAAAINYTSRVLNSIVTP